MRWWLAGLASLASCTSPAVFVCADAYQCVTMGVSGSCEASGYCSFPDGACASARRYGMLAPDHLAGACVHEEAGAGDGPDGADAPAPAPVEDDASSGDERMGSSTTAASVGEPGLGSTDDGASSSDASSTTAGACGGTSPCDACIARHCCEELEACAATPACACAEACVLDGTPATLCAFECGEDLEPWWLLYECRSDACADAC